jgi:hypothetical protein
MTWFAFNNGHPDINAAGAEEKILVSYGFHGYATEAQADQHRNSVNFLQQASLDAWDASHAGRVTLGAAGGSPNDIKTVLGNGFQLTFGNTTGLLGRILKIGFGGILIIEGFLKLSGSGKTITSVIRDPAGKALDGFRMG